MSKCTPTEKQKRFFFIFRAGLDVLVNNAGIPSGGECIRNESVESARAVMDINYFAAYILAKEAIPHLEKVKGNIVFTASQLGMCNIYPLVRCYQSVLHIFIAKKPMAQLGPYCATKAAVAMLAKCIAAEESANVRQN